eukprot:5206086-Pyramimonas_sp.AAC.1
MASWSHPRAFLGPPWDPPRALSKKRVILGHSCAPPGAILGLGPRRCRIEISEARRKRKGEKAHIIGLPMAFGGRGPLVW